jgi:transcriptional regulator with XRE-family HTH domain
MTTAAVARLERAPVVPRRRAQASLCLLCSAVLGRASARGVAARGVCAGCAERLELELTASDGAACPDCGRHTELCAVMPCSVSLDEPQPAPPAAAWVPTSDVLRRRQVSGPERVRAIERLAATHLGVRELGRRTGFAPSTISRWLKIERSPILKRALQTEGLDIGRAKLLADAPESALGDLIPLAAGVSRADLARRIAALRSQTGPARTELYGPSADSRRLLRAVRVVESITHVGDDDRPILEHLRRLVDSLIQFE